MNLDKFGYYMGEFADSLGAGSRLRAHPASQDRAGGPSGSSLNLRSVSTKGAHPLRVVSCEPGCGCRGRAGE